MKKLFSIIAISVLMIQSCAMNYRYYDVKLQGNAPVSIDKVNISHPDNDSRLEIVANWTNVSDKEIKEVFFSFRARNNLGDYVGCTKRTTRGIFVGQDKGPHYSGKASSKTWDDAWYNHSIFSAEIIRIKVLFMDGSKAIIEEDDIILITRLTKP